MRRREFVGGIAGAAFSFLAGARAEHPAKVPRIGILATASRSGDFSQIFSSALRELGWIDGQNVLVDWKLSGGQAQRYDELAVDLVRAKTDVIIAANPNAALAARGATASIPIVMVNTADPVELGLVASLARPGGNVTGTSTLSVEVSAKQLELVSELLPGVSRLAVLSASSNPWHPNAVSALEAGARSLGVKLTVVAVRDPGELEPAFGDFARERVEGALVLADPMTFFYRAKLAEFSIRYHVPAVYGLREYVEAGGLMSYWADSKTVYRRTAAYVDKLLKGSKAADLPVEQPTKYELVINLKTAEALGLTVPPSLLSRADEVIE
jgi:ABC-type uncharacterized transport system substrate-binding protein